MRVYIPATLPMLEQLIADHALRPTSDIAFALTPALREAYVHGDDEELADVALGEAALASLRLLATFDIDVEPQHRDTEMLPVRRVVVVADVDGVTARPDLDDAVVRLSGPVAMNHVVAAYVDTAAAESAVAAAVAVVDRADLGDEDAELAVGDVEDHDLAWYATQELPFLLELL